MPKVTMPQLGESVAEGTIGRWLKKPGDHVAKYEPIVEVITDKVNAEVPSPFEGTLTEILVQEGETVPNNAEIAVIEAAGEGAEAAAGAARPAEAQAAGGPQPIPVDVSGARPEAAAPGGPSPSVIPEPAGSSLGAGPSMEDAEGQSVRPETAPQKTQSGSETRAAEPEMRPSVPETAPSQPAVAVAPTGGDGAASAERTVLGVGAPTREYSGPLTPAVRRLAREHGVDLAAITGTGHGGRVTREDVLAYVEQQRTAAAAPAPSAAAAPPAQPPDAQPVAPVAPTHPGAAPPPAAVPGWAQVGAPGGAAPAAQPPAAAPAPAPAALQDELKPTTPMRKAIAAHMVRAKQTAPHAYTTVEVDMSGVVALRESVKQRYQAQEGVNLSFVAIVAKGVVETLRKHPDLNAHWTDEGLLRKAAVNLGIAVAVEDGLVVPVIKNADQFSIHGLNLFVQDFAVRARVNRLRLDDIQGGTFTLNNTGWFGSVASQPIINVPEVAILSMEAIVKRPVVIETPNGDTIGIRPIMNVCVSFDHRGTDGAQVGRFVQDVRRWLESVDAQTPIW